MAAAIPEGATLDTATALEQELWDTTVAELRLRLSRAGHSTAGRKAELVDRILYTTDWSPLDRNLDGGFDAAEDREQALAENAVAESVGKVAIGLSAWIALASAFYTKHYSWTPAESLFYTIDTGLSIGTGVDGVEDTDDLGRIFTMVNVIVGAWVAMAGLSAIVEYGIDNEQPAGATELTLGARVFVKLTTKLAFCVYGWIAIGVAFGVFIEEWPVIQALFYACTQLASGGLQAPSRSSESLVFTAVFAVVGFPVFAVWSADVAGAVFHDHTRLVERARSRKATNTPRSDKTDSDWSKFLVEELTARGVLDDSTLDDIKQRFLNNSDHEKRE